MEIPKRILVVDDQAQNRRLLEEVLTCLGYAVESASDGFEALAKITADFDLVLLDVLMPGMDGFEVVRRIREDPKINDIPVIIVTVLDDRETRLKAVEAGANDFISKPIDNLEVRARIAAALEIKEARDALMRHKAELEKTIKERTAKLAESELRHRIVADSAYDWEYWEDADGKLQYMAPSCTRITGYSVDEFMADPSLLVRIVHPDDRPLVSQHIKAVRQGRSDNKDYLNFRILRKDGNIAWINHACVPVQAQEGKSLGRRVSNRDVTSERLLQEALDETRDLARLVIDNLPVAIMYVDRDERFVMANRTYRSWLDRVDDDLRGLTVSQVLKDQYSEIQSHVENALRGNEVSYERTARYEDGVTREVRVTLVPHFGADGDVKGLACLISDVTATNRHERELLRIRAAVDGATDAIAMATPKGEHFYQNRAFTNLFGYEIDDLREFSGPIRAYSSHEVAAGIFESIARGRSWAGEAEMVTKDGRRLHVHVRANAITDEEGKIVSLLGVHTDITEFKLMQTALQKSSAALAASQERFATLFERAQDSIFFKDTDLRYTDVNPAMAELFGMSRSAFVGKTDEDLLGKEIFGRTHTIEHRVLRGQAIENQEIFSLGNQPLYWSVLRFPLQDEENAIRGLCGIAREMDQSQLRSLTAQSVLDEHRYPSAAMGSVISAARSVCRLASTVLLTGETGSGKDYLARYIHDNSPNNLGPFLTINCAAIPLELAEAELFGHEAGAFTGALRRKKGMLELAEGGTLLLNEIGDMPHSLQAKLLTFLDTFSFDRVGGEKKITVNIRLIAATSKNLWREVSESRFRQDLFYRLNVYPIHVPPLRERIEDMPILVKEIVVQLTSKRGIPIPPKVGHGAVASLMTYSWPGNVRELRNVLERALILSEGGPIHPSHLILGNPGQSSARPKKNAPKEGAAYELLADMERSFIKDALRRSRGKREQASNLLGISRYALARRMKKLGLEG
jgi:PAS domain S-box-containing protein